MYYVYMGLPGCMPNDDPSVHATIQDARESASWLRKAYTNYESGETFQVNCALRGILACLLKDGISSLPMRYGSFSHTNEAIYIGYDPDLQSDES